MRKLHDRFFNQAKREGKLARSVYKLEELDQKERLFRKGARVLDLGASPGSWLEYIIEAVGPEGLACAVDVKPIHKKFKDRARFIMRDIREIPDSDFAAIAPGGFDAVVSDMAPNTSGVKIVDQARSLELCECALGLAVRRLRKNGNFVCKIFCGPETDAFRDKVASLFKIARIRKPDACRSESREMYIIGIKKIHGLSEASGG